MSELTHITKLQRLSPQETPGLAEYLHAWWRGDSIPRPAQDPLHQRVPEARGGTAWADPEFQAELQAAHRRLDAAEASLANLSALAEGAPCVISGQQPALFGGPLYAAWKLAGAVGLSQELSRRWKRRVVPVYWCGADDSDFDEARSVWVRRAEGAAWQASLPAELVATGTMVGSVSGQACLTLEASLAEFLGEELDPALGEVLGVMPGDFDLGERVISAFLRLFAESGLVFVDARSLRLRELGRPLFASYAEHHAEIAQAVDGRGAQLEEAGFTRPLHPSATRSGLFALRENRRVKLEAPEFAKALEAGESLSPSVLLRAPLQDSLLAPVAAVLGPSELQYHAQLAPAYSILGVEAAAPAPRPHLCLLPPTLVLPDASASRRQLLNGGDGARELLLESLVPEEWKAHTDRLDSELESALQRWRGSMGAVAQEEDLNGLRRRWRLGLQELRRRVQARALEGDAADRAAIEDLPEWLAVRGIPQERAYASWLGWQWFGASFSACTHELGTAYALDLLAGVPSLYCTRLPLEA